MLVSSYSSLNADLQQALRQGQPLILEVGHLRRLHWTESVVRWLNRGQALQQDQEVAEWLIENLNQAQGTKTHTEILETASRYVKACHRTNHIFKRLENVIFAHKCHHQLPSLRIEELIEKDGSPKDELLNFLKQNSLHYVISKANVDHKETALLLKGKEIYIRSKEGTSFLNTPAHIDLILERLPTSHPDHLLLTELRLLLDKKSDLLLSTEDKRVKEIGEQLKLSHYIYQSLKDVHRNEKGLLISQSYLANGIEDFEHSRWSELKPNFREKTSKSSYKLRVVTRLPVYALEKTWLGTMKGVLRNLFDFRAHGHSWIEITEPIHDKEGKFTQHQNVYNVGYYFHPLNRYKRFESADPMAYMPIPSEQIIVEEVELSQEQYEKTQFYLKEVQALLNNPKRCLDDRPKGKKDLSKTQIEDIQYIYKSTLKSTCLSFANTLKEVITGIETDHRSEWRRWISPKREFKRWDRIDGFVDKTLILRWLIRLPRFLMRMELPFWVKHQPPEVRKKVETTAT